MSGRSAWSGMLFCRPAPFRKVAAMRNLTILFATALLLQGCTYAISPATTSRADKTIPFEKLLTDPERYAGTLVILGGTITTITVVKQGTAIEVLQKNLDYWGKPERTKRSGGSFVVLHPAKLDPMVYAPGRDITIAGEVLGSGSSLLKNQHYDAPVLLWKEHKLWERERLTMDKPQWFDPLHDPYTDPGNRNW